VAGPVLHDELGAAHLPGDGDRRLEGVRVGVRVGHDGAGLHVLAAYLADHVGVLALRADRDDLAAARRGDGAARPRRGHRGDDRGEHGEQQDRDGTASDAAPGRGTARIGPARAAAHAHAPDHLHRPGTSVPDWLLMIIVSIISKQLVRRSRRSPFGRRPWLWEGRPANLQDMTLDHPRGTRVRGTKQASAVAAALASLPGFRSAQEIHAALRRQGETVGLTTVYRHLQVLSEQGVIDTIRDPSGESLYRQCDTTAHHHHLTCRECGRSVEVEGRVVEQWAEKVAAEAGFTSVNHTVELFGLCPDHSAR